MTACLTPLLLGERSTQRRDNIKIINQDILKTDLHELVNEFSPNRKVKVVANLPYYITTPIIMRFLEKVPLKTMVIMIQKEVANRINAVPSTKDYGSLSVAVQYYCDTDIVAKSSKEHLSQNLALIQRL